MSIERNTHPFTARSVILSVLLGTEPPRLPVSLLVSTTALFGINDNTTRTALSRMSAAGEVRSVDGRYEISSPRLLDRQARQATSRRGVTTEWSGEWIQAVVVADGQRPAAERASLRASLAAHRLVELREGVWLRPDNLADPPPALDDLVWFCTRPDADPAALAARLWDLDAWRATAERLDERVEQLLPRLEAGDRTTLAEGFVLSADVLRHLQADPLLPMQLLSPSWPGGALRANYERYDGAYREVLRSWFDEHR